MIALEVKRPFNLKRTFWAYVRGVSAIYAIMYYRFLCGIKTRQYDSGHNIEFEYQ